MSSITCLLILLLCLSLHACDGRRLTVLSDRNKHEKHSQNSNQNGQKEKLAAAKVEISASSISGDDENLSAVSGGKAAEATSNLVVEDAYKQLKMKDPTLVKTKQTMKMERSRKSGALQKSVTWRVPKNKQREKHPGFNLDYSPPKTHPPSHN